MSMTRVAAPLMTAAMLALGLSACNNSKNQKLEHARYAVEFAKTYGEDGAEFLAKYNTYDISALDAIQEETDNETAKAFDEFQLNDNNTRWDSLYISNLIEDRRETQKAISYLKAKAAMNPDDYKSDRALEIAMEVEEAATEEPEYTAKEQDSIAEANINNYKSEQLQRQLLRITSVLNDNTNSNKRFMRDMTILMNKILETVQDTANAKDDSIMPNNVIENFN